MRRFIHPVIQLFARTLAKTLRRPRVHVGEGVLAYGLPYVRTVRGSRIDIGPRVNLVSTTFRNPIGINHRVILRTLHPGATISIGEGTGMSGGTLLAAKSISIGAHCLIGVNVTVVDNDFHPVHSRTRSTDPIPTPRDRDAVTIGDNVLIGMGSMILKGVTIGDDCVIGAGSVVTRDCEPGVIVAGNPARPVGKVDLDRTP